MSTDDPNSLVPVTPAPPPRSASSATSDLVKVVGQFVGAIAGIAGTIYLVGTLLLLVRLAWTRGVSGVGQIPQLSRDVLLALGLEVILVPLAIGVGYAIFRIIVRKPEPEPPTRNQKRGVKLRIRVELGALIASPALGAWIIAATNGHAEMGTVWKVLVGVGIAGLAWGLALLTARAWEMLGETYVKEAAEAYPNNEEQTKPLAETKWNSMGAIMIVSLLFAAANVPSWAFVAMSVPLGHALVCPKTGEPEHGYLVGEGSSRTYLALYHGHTIVSFPNDQVVRVLTGDRRDLISCPPVPAS